MGLPRRGGPSGRYLSWLGLSKRHKDLRKLIPIYFPANSISSGESDSLSYQASVEAESSSGVFSNEHSNLLDTVSNEFIQEPKPEHDASSSKHSLLWNIDEHSTNQLHDLLNPKLIYQSLNMSPIHWKCVPQLRGLEGKHCAALCGVIIQKRFKKRKPSTHPAVSGSRDCPFSPVQALEAVSLKERNDTEVSQLSYETSIPNNSEHSASMTNVVCNLTSKTDESHRQHSKNLTQSVNLSPAASDKENIPRSRRTTFHGTLKQEAATSLAAQKPDDLCRFCHRSPRMKDKPARGTCTSCNTFLHSFGRTCRSLEDFICLRDVPCAVRWPVSWIPPEDLSESKENQGLLEHGPFGEDWCDPCKVVHCVKLGCKLTEFCGKRSAGFPVMRSFDLNAIGNPEFQHRTRERRVKSYLDILKQDFGNIYFRSPDDDVVVSPLSCQYDQVPYERFLDLLWVRPLHLLSHQQLHSAESATVTEPSSPDTIKPSQSECALRYNETETIVNRDSKTQSSNHCDICSLSLSSPSVPCHVSAQSGLHDKLLRTSVYEISLGPHQLNRKERSESRKLTSSSTVDQLTACVLVSSDHLNEHSCCPDKAVVIEKMDVEAHEVTSHAVPGSPFHVTRELTDVAMTSVGLPVKTDHFQNDDSHHLTNQLTHQDVLSSEPAGQLSVLNVDPPSQSQHSRNVDASPPFVSNELTERPVDDSLEHHSNCICDSSNLKQSTSHGELNTEVTIQGQVELSYGSFDLSVSEPRTKSLDTIHAREYNNSLLTTVSICGPCLLRIRRISSNLRTASSSSSEDSLAALMHTPGKFCSNNSQENRASYAICSGPLCDHCYLYQCLDFIYRRLCQKVNPTTVVSDSPSSSYTHPSGLFLPVGGPLILPIGSSDGNTAKLLFTSHIGPRCLMPITEQSTCVSTACFCCRSDCELLSSYSVVEDVCSICSGCLWTFKAGLLSVVSDPYVMKIAKRLASAAAATDSSIPLLSRSSRRTIIDIACLAYLLGASCSDRCPSVSFNGDRKLEPLWLTCPACTVRRCFRLLPASLPVHPPPWYRRRLKLFSNVKYLEDLDPRLLCPKLGVPGGLKIESMKSSHKLLIADIEFTSSVIERWLTPPELYPLSQTDAPVSSVADSGHSSSTPDSEDSSGGDALSACSSGFSANSSLFNFSDHSSAYGEDGWWDTTGLIEAIDKPAPIEEDSSATEPETDAVRAEELTIPDTVDKKLCNSMDTGFSTGLGFHPKCEAIDSSMLATTSGTVEPSISMVKAILPNDPVIPDRVFKIEDQDKTESCYLARSKSSEENSEPKSPSSEVSQKIQSQKRGLGASENLILKGKRRLKINHRFLDDFDGTMPRLIGHGRRTRHHSGDSYESNSSSRTSGSVSFNRRTSHSSRVSLMAQKRAHARLNTRIHTSCEGSSAKASQSSVEDLSDKSPDCSSREVSTGPRVKQISRPAIKQDENRYSSALSAMVHAARLAAVGAKIPGGTSPNHAALAATTRASLNDKQDHRFSEADTTNLTPIKSFGRSLPDRCGQCPACCGLIQPCGRCNNCRSLQQSTKIANAQPCKELTCFRRRPNQSGSRTGPRVKIPCNFQSPGASAGLSQPIQKGGDINHTNPSKLATDNFSITCGTPDAQSEPVSLLDTVPGLAQQLELGTWLPSSSDIVNNDSTAPLVHPKDYFRSDRRLDVLNVHSDVRVTPIPGGDLGMRFSTSRDQDSSEADGDRIQPLEGEVVTTELSHHGGYAIVTTMASAPPKELCYACGSGGGQLLFCVSCAEPFHFYCVERQFRPRRKDHFLCRNCTNCHRCHQPAADLRCVRCSRGYHPHCLPDYAPAQSGQRGNWVCPFCTTCVHCGLRPLGKPSDASSHSGGTADLSTIMVPWSPEPTKCAACSLAEARGDICPECDRAYLPSAKQMIQCDTCQLWMHRTCTKLTADEYEFIARLPSGQLNKFVVNCTVCQNERKQQEGAGEHELSATPSNGDLGDGGNRLRSLARDTLMERMSGLASGCRRSGDSDLPVSQTASVSQPAFDANLQSPTYPSLQPSDTARSIPQLDGVYDNDSGDAALSDRPKPRTHQRSSYQLPLVPASDFLLSDHFDPSGTTSPSSFTSDLSTRFYNDNETGSHASVHSCKSAMSIMSPPVSASWIVENETKHMWTSPRFLIYRTLTRILHRLATFPVSSSQAINLRRLLRWLSSTTESLFPWLNITEMANDVRDILRQAHGEFDAVLRHFEKCTIMEMHELLCPIVARQMDLFLYSRLSPTSATARPWNNVAGVHKCFSMGLQHLRSHHPSLLAMTDPLPDQLAPFHHVIIAKSAVESAGLSQCNRPHELEVIEKMRNETREERWVEHWSTIEEDLVLGKFQRHLRRLYRRMVKDAGSTEMMSRCPSANNLAESDDDGKGKINSVLPGEQKVEQGDVSADEHVVREKMDDGRDYISQFYFSAGESWITSGSNRPPSSSKVRMSVDLDEDDRDRTGTPSSDDTEQSSSDEDVRCCLLCGGHGDNNIEGRLLFTGADTWVHVNCALWSNEVYEEETGQLIGLSDALRRARLSKCPDCGNYGSTLLCSNAHEPTCTLYNEPWTPQNDCDYDLSVHNDAVPKAVHFACALRRRPPTPKSVFTADRSWFCSPECHQSAMRQRLSDAIKIWRHRKHNRLNRTDDQDIMDLMNKEDYSMLENSVADDLEPISLGELLVCRRVFVPSDCFVASLHPSRLEASSVRYPCRPDDSHEVIDAMHQALSNLSVSPSSSAFLHGSGLPASALVITVGSLRVDRLGEVREASDSLAMQKIVSSPDTRSHLKQMSFLCPINYRARRIYWSCYKLDDRVSYTLHVKQMHAVNHAISTGTSDSAPLKKLSVATRPVRSESSDSSPPLLPVEWKSVKSIDVARSDSHSGMVRRFDGVSRSLAIVPCTSRLSPQHCSPQLSNSTVPNSTNVTNFLNPRSSVLSKQSLTTSQLSVSTPHPQYSSIKIFNPSTPVHLTKVDSSKTSTSILRSQLQQQFQPLRVVSTFSFSQANGMNGTLRVPHSNSTDSAAKSNYSSVTMRSNKLPIRIPVQSSMPIQSRIVPISVVTGADKLCRIPVVQNVLTKPRTTPSKDVQLADQLNGIFKNLPSSGPELPGRASSNQVNHVLNQVVSHPPNVTICMRAPQRLLPQLDGTVDSDDDSMSRSSKRSRTSARDVAIPRKQSGSVVSSSSYSATPRETDLSRNSKLCASQPKRRWIEERNKQHELAQLVSKAKLANHARLYQNEVEKHARSFKLRFAVEGVVRAAANPTSAWRHVLFRVASLRDKQGLPALINDSTDGWAQFGLSHRYIVFLIEQMRGAFHCYRYRFRYHWRKIENLRRKFTPPLPVSEGCARAIPWSKPRVPNHHARDPLSFLSCKANPPPRPLLNSSSSPATRSNSQPLEPTTLLSPNEQKVCTEAAREAASLVATQLKLPARIRDACIAQAVVQATGFPVQTSKTGDSACKSRPELNEELNESGERTESDSSFDNASAGVDEGDEIDLGTVTTQFKRMVSGYMARYLRVSVHPSRIHGRGLFALRGFREDEMVIEYLGELIRNFVCETREIRYRAAGVDCYMFRIDQDLVIDATYAGNAARFINHSCEPNCYAKVITVEDKKHIVILAQRRIYPGEELTYDYRFPKESDKLLCNCGSFHCRKYLN